MALWNPRTTAVKECLDVLFLCPHHPSSKSTVSPIAIFLTSLAQKRTARKANLPVLHRDNIFRCIILASCACRSLRQLSLVIFRGDCARRPAAMSWSWCSQQPAVNGHSSQLQGSLGSLRTQGKWRTWQDPRSVLNDVPYKPPKTTIFGGWKPLAWGHCNCKPKLTRVCFACVRGQLHTAVSRVSSIPKE